MPATARRVDAPYGVLRECMQRDVEDAVPYRAEMRVRAKARQGCRALRNMGEIRKRLGIWWKTGRKRPSEEAAESENGEKREYRQGISSGEMVEGITGDEQRKLSAAVFRSAQALSAERKRRFRKVDLCRTENSGTVRNGSGAQVPCCAKGRKDAAGELLRSAQGTGGEILCTGHLEDPAG